MPTALLQQAGIVGADADRINRIACGHPLSLRLAAAALLEYAGVDREVSTVNAMVEALTALYLARLDPATRQVLDAAAAVRRPTMSLLAAMLPEAAPQDAFERLRSLPFVEVRNDGLKAGARYAKNGTGYSPRGATPEQTRLVRQSVPVDVLVKAAGCIRTLAAMLELIDAAAVRIGTSATVAIADEWRRAAFSENSPGERSTSSEG